MSRPATKATARPTTVEPPTILATSGWPSNIEAMQTANEIRTTVKARPCPLFISVETAFIAASLMRRVSLSVSCLCLISDSAMRTILSASPGMIASYPLSTSGGGIGPEKEAEVTETCFAFCLSGRLLLMFLTMWSNRAHGRRKSLADLFPVAAKVLGICFAGTSLKEFIIGRCRINIQHAADAFQNVFYAGRHDEKRITNRGVFVNSRLILKGDERWKGK